MRVFLNCVVLVAVVLALSAGQLHAETVLANVAVYQLTSGDQGWGYYPTSNGVDDTRDGSSFTHTEGSLDAFWRVELDAEYTVDHVEIACRPGYPDRTNGATLQAYDDTNSPVGPLIDLTGYSSSVYEVSFDNGGSPWTGVQYFQVNVGNINPADPYLHIGEFVARGVVEGYPNFIGGVTATAVNGYPWFTTEPKNIVSGRGMDDQGPGMGAPSAQHYNIWGDGIFHSDGINPPVITFDLGGTHDLASMVIWNETQSDIDGQAEGPGTRGIKECLIEVSPNGTDWTALPNTNDDELGNYTLNKVDGLGGPYSATDDLDLTGVTASHVRLTGLSSHGSPYMGLAEVRFYQVPEPSMLVLLALGSLVLLGRRMK